MDDNPADSCAKSPTAFLFTLETIHRLTLKVSLRTGARLFLEKEVSKPVVWNKPLLKHNHDNGVESYRDLHRPWYLWVNHLNYRGFAPIHVVYFVFKWISPCDVTVLTLSCC